MKNLLKLSSIIRKTMATTSNQTKIQNFAFLDLETTGLPYEEYNRTRITELCITMVESGHIGLGVFPRVQNKLNMCFQPFKMIQPGSTDITGLANDMLENQTCFSKDVVDTINNFLNFQKKPICLVAHNGNRFDYPILQAEIKRVGGSLAPDLLCIDSLACFQELHRLKEENEQLKSDTQISPEISYNEFEIEYEYSDEYDELLCAAFDEYEATMKKQNIQKINETTPKKQTLMKETRRGISTSTEKKQRLSFKLPDIYKRLTNKDPTNSHHAEGDVDCLIHCAAVCGDDFVDWANENAKLFSEIPPMRPGVKIGF